MKFLTSIYAILRTILFTYLFITLTIDYLSFQTTTSITFLKNRYEKLLPAISFCYKTNKTTLLEKISDVKQTDLIDEVFISNYDKIVLQKPREKKQCTSLIRNILVLQLIY